MNKKDFLSKDLPAVLKHYKICKHCLIAAEEAMSVGNLDLAEQKMREFEFSLREIKKLKGRKDRNDQLAKIAKELSKKGVLIEVIRRNTIG